MNILHILKSAHTDRILRPQIFRIGEKHGLSRKEIKRAIKEAEKNGLKSRMVIRTELDDDFRPYNHKVLEYHV